MREEKPLPLIGRRLGGGIDRMTRKAKVEQSFLNQRDERMATRCALLANSI